MATAAANKLVFLDLEATGFEKPDIVQIAAVDFSGRNTFNEYITPTKDFEEGATNKTGLIRGPDGGLFRSSGAKISTRPVGQVLAEFVGWLESIRTHGECIVLVAYNGFGFDFHVLLHHLSVHKLNLWDKAGAAVTGFSDPYRLATKTDELQDRTAYGGGMTLARLLQLLDIAPTGDAHDAYYDAMNLRALSASLASCWKKQHRGTYAALSTEDVFCIPGYGRKRLCNWYMSANEMMRKAKKVAYFEKVLKKKP